jgi:hypothetical protein
MTTLFITLSLWNILAPLYDVSTVLLWDHVNQYHARNLLAGNANPVTLVDPVGTRSRWMPG